MCAAEPAIEQCRSPAETTDLRTTFTSQFHQIYLCYNVFCSPEGRNRPEFRFGQCGLLSVLGQEALSPFGGGWGAPVDSKSNVKASILSLTRVNNTNLTADFQCCYYQLVFWSVLSPFLPKNTGGKTAKECAVTWYYSSYWFVSKSCHLKQKLNQIRVQTFLTLEVLEEDLWTGLGWPVGDSVDFP